MNLLSCKGIGEGLLRLIVKLLNVGYGPQEVTTVSNVAFKALHCITTAVLPKAWSLQPWSNAKDIGVTESGSDAMDKKHGPITPVSPNGSSYILTLGGSSCFKKLTVHTTPECVYKTIIVRHGMPKAILSDQGNNFTSKLFRYFCKKLNIDEKLKNEEYSNKEDIVMRIGRTSTCKQHHRESSPAKPSPFTLIRSRVASSVANLVLPISGGSLTDNDEDIEEDIDENADLNSSRPTSSMSTGSSKSVSGSRGPQKSHPVLAHFKQEMVEGKHKKEAQELVSAEEIRKESDNSKCKSLKRKTDEKGSIDKFLSGKKSLGRAYSKSSEKYPCTTISQNAFQSLEFKRYIEECDPNAAACIPSRPTLTSWVIDFSTLACHSLEQPHNRKAIKYALDDCLEKNGFRDSSNVFRYVTDKGANVICALKPYKILMAVPSQYLSDFDDEFPVDFFMEESEELDGDESEQITEILDLDSEASEEEESQIEDDNEDNMDWVEEEFPKRLTCIDHELNTMCHRVLDKTTSPISKLKCRVLPLINRFSKSGVAVEKLKYLAVKKLLKTRENLLGELKSRFSLIMDPYSRNFDSTFLICTMLSPLKTTKLDDELFSTGKQRLKMHLLSPSASITSIRETLSSSTSTVTSTEGKTSVSDGLHTSNKKEEQKIAAQQDLCKKRRIVMTDSSSKSQQQLLKEEIEKELEEYFSYLDKNLNATDLTLSQEDPSHFWVQNSLRFPYLSKTAFDFLAIPATSASTERLFSGAELSTDGNRGNIGPKLLESEACAKYNYRELFKDLKQYKVAPPSSEVLQAAIEVLFLSNIQRVEPQFTQQWKRTARSSTPQTRIFEVPSGVNYCFPVTETSDVPTLGFSPILPVKKVELPTSAAIIQSTLFDVAFPPTEPRPDQSFICSHRDNFERLNSDPLFSGSSQSLQCVNHNPYTGKPLHKHVPQTVTGGDPSQHSLGAVTFLYHLETVTGLLEEINSIGGSEQFTEDSFSENSTVNSTTEEYSGEEESILSNVNIDTKKPVSTDRSSKSYPDSKDNNKQQPKQKEANRTSSAIYRWTAKTIANRTHKRGTSALA
ncbi:hypothetical protein OUZ56_032875 [Daphnia magna]|uniref:HAT C-terminal dimerisation domain-containing protein n=2 Tax=Daphnia magna TaxID=35525 RepID=A0ABR0B9S8_9CRUS|nr:hypothetical protein OUZ56_032875 [Daphnia magna]